MRVLLACGVLAVSLGAAAQPTPPQGLERAPIGDVFPDLRPGDARIPAPAPDAPVPPLGLPPLPDAPPDAGFAAGLRVEVQRFEVRGATVFTPEQFASALSHFTGRAIDTEELLAARDTVTRLYVDAGYVTSGAVLPDQDVRDGVMFLDVIENGLGEVAVSGNRGFHGSFFESRLLAAGRAPLRVQQIESALRRLQRDPRIERIDAVLEPGLRRGESRLAVRVVEGARLRLGLEAANDRSPAVGSGGGAGDVTLFNLAGRGDALTLSGEISEGVRDYQIRVATPITRWDTGLALRYRQTDVEIVERPFDTLDIESRSRTLGVELEHPLYRGERDEIWVGAIGEWRDLETTILGFEFCFEPEPGISNPLSGCRRPRATVLRASTSWTRSSERDVLALRSLLSFGIDAFGASTRSDRDLADGRFVAWLAQAQWAHVLPESLLGSHLILRADLQLASEPLLSFEQFAIGGRTSVRGYRENRLVTDNGVIASGEVRIPLWRDALGRHLLEVVPFTDFGHGWDEVGDVEDDVLWSAGVGLRVRPFEHVLAEGWWGGQFETVDDPDRVLQDRGVHLRIRVDVP